ncbi:carboxypeptidase-like regulatory domain-containing protein [Planctomicrobium sp. SH661]|uniref:carboxypeptidase-like regulatory domain-containing protein n=1 Tax=Planctomicrobium sp. SH661 TaxID=3448124 RepID=UPI003F5AE45C
MTSPTNLAVKRVRTSLRFLGPCILLSAFILSACGSGRNLPELGTVQGVVTLDGQPLSNANVSFDPTAEGRSSSGFTDAQGRYDLRYGLDVKGAKLGSYNVRIWTYQKGGDEPGSAPEIPELVPEKYHKPGALTADVKDATNTVNFELTTK